MALIVFVNFWQKTMDYSIVRRFANAHAGYRHQLAIIVITLTRSSEAQMCCLQIWLGGEN